MSPTDHPLSIVSLGKHVFLYHDMPSGVCPFSARQQVTVPMALSALTILKPGEHAAGCPAGRFSPPGLEDYSISPGVVPYVSSRCRSSTVRSLIASMQGRQHHRSNPSPLCVSTVNPLGTSMLTSTRTRASQTAVNDSIFRRMPDRTERPCANSIAGHGQRLYILFALIILSRCTY